MKNISKTRANMSSDLFSLGYKSVHVIFRVDEDTGGEQMAHTSETVCVCVCLLSLCGRQLLHCIRGFTALSSQSLSQCKLV